MSCETMKIWRIFLASTYIIYMRNTWSNINMDHHSLNWAKKNSTSRIHPTKLTGKLQVMTMKRYGIFKIALGWSQLDNSTSRIHPMKLILVESLLLSLLLCLSSSLMPGICGCVRCIHLLCIDMVVICLPRMMKSGSDETIDVDE